MEVWKILDMLSSTLSSKDKQSILRTYKTLELVKTVVISYNPFINFYIKKIPDYEVQDTPTSTLSEALDKLSVLSSRELTGNASIEFLKNLLESLSKEDANVLERVIQRDLKVGCNVKTFNSVFGSNCIPEVPYMGAIPFSAKKVQNLFNNSSFAYSQVKMDGKYANVIITEDSIRIESREGNPIDLPTSFGNLHEYWKFFNKDVVLNGELVVSGFNRSKSNGIVKALSTYYQKIATEDPKPLFDTFYKKYGEYPEYFVDKLNFVIWDYIPYSNYKELHWDVPYETRFNEVTKFVEVNNLKNISIVETKIVRNMEEAREFFSSKISAGEEGTVLKSSKGFWVNGKPDTQCKFKIEFTCDLLVKSFNKGTEGKRRENSISSINCESSEGLLKASACGISDELADDFYNNSDKYLNMVIEVKSNGISCDKEGNPSLLNPIFIAIRDDTTPDTYEEILQNYQMTFSLR